MQMRKLNTKPQFSFDKKWSLPEGLKRLEAWLERHGVDVYAFKTERHCLTEVESVTGFQIDWPDRDQSCLPALLQIQEIVSPLHSQTALSTGRPPWRSQREPFLKSKGAASPVRGVSQNVLAEIIQRYNLETESAIGSNGKAYSKSILNAAYSGKGGLF